MTKIAYFSMEVALRAEMPTYSGGLGVLAGDTLKSAADLGLDVIGISLLHRKGYFHQSIDEQGVQSDSPVLWNLEDFLTPLNLEFNIEIAKEKLKLKAWRYEIVGVSGASVPVYFLDANLAQNKEKYRTLTDRLYGGNSDYRLMQEIVLGIGGSQLIESLSLSVDRFHLNEGHAAFLTCALAHKLDSVDEVKKRCVFTTHTPVAAGHDQFSIDRVKESLAEKYHRHLEPKNGVLNMTELAASHSGYINGVSQKHGEISRKMLADERIDSITNGIHAGTWVGVGLSELFDGKVLGWRSDQNRLRELNDCSLSQIKSAHLVAKKLLLEKIKLETGKQFDEKVFTIGFGRRAATYKRLDLIFKDLQRLKKIAPQGLQLVFAGKSHPADQGGKKLIQEVFQKAQDLDEVKFVYLENYDMNLGKLMCAGVDLWLNNPVKPMEASGTSGMKAALNGIPSLSTLDGWWIEGCIEGVTGWEIVDSEDGFASGSEDGLHSDQAANSLYDKLENTILPMYYEREEEYLRIRRNCIVLNGSHFNTQRMVEQYNKLAWQCAVDKVDRD